MAIKVNNREVIDDGRRLSNIEAYEDSVKSTFRNIIRYTDVATPVDVNNRDYIIVTSTGAVEPVITLSAAPQSGNEVTIGKDNSAGKVTIDNNGNNIMGIAEPLILDIPNTIVRLAYHIDALGWVIC